MCQPTGENAWLGPAGQPGACAGQRDSHQAEGKSDHADCCRPPLQYREPGGHVHDPPQHVEHEGNGHQRDSKVEEPHPFHSSRVPTQREAAFGAHFTARRSPDEGPPFPLSRRRGLGGRLHRLHDFPAPGTSERRHHRTNSRTYRIHLASSRGSRAITTTRPPANVAGTDGGPAGSSLVRQPCGWPLGC